MPEKTGDKIVSKLRYNIPTEENQEAGENGYLKVEKETLSRTFENIKTDDVKKEIESLIEQGFDVDVTIKPKIPKD